MSEAITADYLEGFLGNRRLMDQLAFILEVEKLKTVLRKTPLLDRSRVALVHGSNFNIFGLCSCDRKQLD